MTLKITTSKFGDNHQMVSIPAVLRSRSKAALGVPVVAGLCVPQGQLVDAARGRVEGFSQSVKAQFEVLNRWNDGSVRWMLASFIAPEASAAPRDVSVVASQCESTTNLATTGFTTIKFVNGEILISTRDLTSDPPTERTQRLKPCFRDADGDELVLQLDSIREELTGEIRRVSVISTRIRSLPFVTVQMRLTYWTDAGLLQVETRLRNTRRARHPGGLWDLGDAGSLFFRSLEVSIRSDEIPAGATTHWKAERDQAVRSTTSEVFIRQFGSGNRFRARPHHLTAAGTIDVENCGYEVISDAGLWCGDRAEPTFQIEGDSAFLAVAVPEFWQQFPGSIAAAMGTLEVGLFPALPGVIHELQGGEQKTQSFWLSNGDRTGDLQRLDWVYDSPRLLQSPVSVANAKVLPWFAADPACLRSGSPHFDHPTEVSSFSSRAPAPADKNIVRSESVTDRAGVLAHYLTMATSGQFSLESRRSSIDEYGWRNFGDVPADHEQTHYAGSNTIVSHYNNQFDMIFGGILQAAATGDLQWFDLFDPLARHVMDIDIYHTNADRAAFNGGLFWHTDHYVDACTSTHRTYSKHNQKPGQLYGGGPSCEHNYTTGLLHYHFMTGSTEARESVLSLAEWVIQMDDGRNTIFGFLDNGPTGAASATVFEDFHGPGRGAGNSMNALLDAWVLTDSSRYLIKLEELIRRCVHPSQNPDELHLLDAEGHWSYTVFLNSLGRYLLAKRDAEHFDGMYSYARDVMKTYGRWMAINERRTLDLPEELQYPTEAWAAQDFRKANVLRIAASCEDDATQAEAMRNKATEINDAAWNDFAAFREASLTARCLSIVMTEGRRDLFHRSSEPDLISCCPATYKADTWSMFVPQKQRVKQLLRSPISLLKALVCAMNPQRLIPAWQALQRQM